MLLRPAREDDRAALERILVEPEVAKWWGMEPPSEVVDDILRPSDGQALVVDVDGVAAGAIQFGEEDDPSYRHGYIDLFLGANYQGRGLGRDAVRTIARYLFDECGHHRVTIDPSLGNERAIRAYERVGFKRVGVMRQYERGPDGEWRDSLLMDLLKDELR